MWNKHEKNLIKSENEEENHFMDEDDELSEDTAQRDGWQLHLKFAQSSLVRSTTVFEANQGLSLHGEHPQNVLTQPVLVPQVPFLSFPHRYKDKGIEAKWIETTKQKADIFTKGLPEAQFQAIRKLLMGWWIVVCFIPYLF